MPAPKLKLTLAELSESFSGLFLPEAAEALSAAIEKELAPALRQFSEKKANTDNNIEAILRQTSNICENLQSLIYELKNQKEREKILRGCKSVYWLKAGDLDNLIAKAQEAKKEIETA